MALRGHCFYIRLGSRHGAGKSGSQPDGRKTEFSVRALWKDASREGFLAMLLDVSAQMSVTLGIYTAGTRLGLGAMYQISSLQAAFPQFGLAWIWGITYILRLSGTQMVFRGDYEQFRGLFIFAVRYCTLLIVAVTFSVIPFKDALAFHQAEQACDYASDLACLPHYEHIFGGGGSKLGTLQETFMYFFVPVLFARCFFQAARQSASEDTSNTDKESKPNPTPSAQPQAKLQQELCSHSFQPEPSRA